MTYTYDAWGKPLTTTDILDTGLGQLNPLRYRGYVYDTETGLYYLQSRYYDPAVGRFISPDSFVSTGQGFVGNNMFAYCLNNPVCRKDILGTYSVDIFDSDGDLLSDEEEFGGGGGGGKGGKVSPAPKPTPSGNPSSPPTVKTINNGGTSNIESQLQECAKIANTQVPGKGAVPGTYKHTVFANEVKKLGNSSLRTEVSYLNGQEVSYGTKGSVRFDVVQVNTEGTPVAVWDLKTGNAVLTPQRINWMLTQSGLFIPVRMIK